MNSKVVNEGLTEYLDEPQNTDYIGTVKVQSRSYEIEEKRYLAYYDHGSK